jgi:hypothetical protein
MYNASPRFFQAIRDSHAMAMLVEVFSSDGELLATTDSLDVISGNVSVDRTAATRRSASLSLVDKEGLVVPGNRFAQDLFHPLSNHVIKIYRGVNYGKVRVPQERERWVQVDLAPPIPPPTDIPSGNEPVDAPYGYTVGSEIVGLHIFGEGEIPVDNGFTVGSEVVGINVFAPFIDPPFGFTSGSPVVGLRIAPTENYVKVKYTTYVEEDDVELIPQGVFDIFDANVEDTRDSITVDLKLFDFSRKIERARLLRNHTVDAGTNFATAIRDVIDQGVPGLTYRFPEVPFLTPRLVFGASGDQEGGDRWKYGREMAESIGYELFMDRQGVVRLQALPAERNQPIVADYTEGKESTFMYVTRSLSKESTYNHVVAVGESTSSEEPVRGFALDNDPNSPTYIGDPYGSGPYGAVPFFLRSKFIRTEEQAHQAAEAKLKQLQGTTEQMRLISIVNPAHDPGDRVRVVRERSKLDCRFVMDSFNVPLDYSGPMNITMRETRRLTSGPS